MAQTQRTTRTRPRAVEPVEDEDDFPDDETLPDGDDGDEAPEDRLADDGDEADDIFDGDDGEDDFDEARAAFVKMDDLEGRLVLVYPHETGERESTIKGQAGKMYTYVVTTTHVLSGPVTDMIESVPLTLDDFQWSGQNIVGQLKPKIRARRAVLGVLGKKEPSQRGMQKAWILNEPTERDKARARKFIAAMKKKKGDVFD